MQIMIQPSPARAALLTARIIDRELRAKPDLVLGLATGRTMEAVYGYLRAFHEREGLDFARCRTFNLDEYIGIPASHPGSYRRTMEENLFSRVNLDPANTQLPDGMATDLKGECRRYEALIKAAGGIDLQLLGLGGDGHIGFNEPLSALLSRTRDKVLTVATREQNAGMFGGDPEQVPHRAITMGVGSILEARRCLLLATGPGKAAILAKAMEGPITSMVTASALQLHAHCEVVVDEAAAALCEGRDYYRYIWENEPDWAPFQDLAALEP
jgi:glucosamine-6-phosphate deaminase